MGFIDYISSHPVGKLQPPADWDKHFVVALIDDFIACLNFPDSTISNFAGPLIRTDFWARDSSTETRTVALQIRLQHKQRSLRKVNCHNLLALILFQIQPQGIDN